MLKGASSHGLFAANDFDENKLIIEYVGEVSATVPTGNRYALRAGKTLLYIDSNKKGNVARFIDNSCKGFNAVAYGVKVNGVIRIAIRAAQTIVSGDEILIAYGSDYRWGDCKCRKCTRNRRTHSHVPEVYSAH